MKLFFFISALSISAFQLLPAEPQAKPLGAGTITRTSDGKTAITTRYGHGTRTVITSPGKPTQSMTTTRYGHGTITRSSDGRSAITSRYGLRSQPAKFSPQSRKGR